MCFSGLTVKLGVRSEVNGLRPLKLRPARLSCTYSLITSSILSRARTSSLASCILLVYLGYLCRRSKRFILSISGKSYAHLFPSVIVYGLLRVMQPNDQYQQQPQVPSDYLNQIAVPTQTKTLNPFVLWGLIVGVLILGIAIVMGVLSGGGGTSSSSLAAVAIKLANLQTVSQDARNTIQSSELRTLNSNLNLSLTNTNRDIAEQLKSQEINIKDKKDKSVVAATKDLEELQGRLEDARLNAVYDRTYAREMLYELRTLNSDMEVLYKKSKNKDLKETLNGTSVNIEPVINGLSTFNES